MIAGRIGDMEINKEQTFRIPEEVLLDKMLAAGLIQASERATPGS